MSDQKKIPHPTLLYSLACVAGVYLIKFLIGNLPCPVYSCTVLPARCNLHTSCINKIHPPLPLYIYLLYGSNTEIQYRYPVPDHGRLIILKGWRLGNFVSQFRILRYFFP